MNRRFKYLHNNIRTISWKLRSLLEKVSEKDQRKEIEEIASLVDMLKDEVLMLCRFYPVGCLSTSKLRELGFNVYYLSRENQEKVAAVIRKLNFSDELWMQVRDLARKEGIPLRTNWVQGQKDLFQVSCLLRVIPQDVAEHLWDRMYDCASYTSKEPTCVLTTQDGLYTYLSPEEADSLLERNEEHVPYQVLIDCGTNTELFYALTSLRRDGDDRYRTYIFPDGKWCLTRDILHLDDFENPHDCPQKASLQQILALYNYGGKVDLSKVVRFQINPCTSLLLSSPGKIVEVSDYKSVEQALAYVMSNVGRLSHSGYAGNISCQTEDGMWHFYSEFQPQRER